MQAGAHTCTVPFLFYIYTSTHVGCAGSSSVCRLFSDCGEQGLSFTAACGLSLWWLLLLRSTGSQLRGLQELLHVASVVAAPKLQSTDRIDSCDSRA